MAPETRYAQSGDVSIAYQVVGTGARDLVLVPGWVSNLEVGWEFPPMARLLERLASFSRLILFDKRGTGLSDRVANMPTLEERMDDVRAILDSVGSEKATIFGYSEGGAMSALFASTYPRRTDALIMHGAFARRCAAPGHPWGPSREQFEKRVEEYRQSWGGPVRLEAVMPSFAADSRARDWWARYLRASASPGAAAMLTRMNGDIDVRPVLSAIRTPSLLMHSRRDLMVPVEASRFMAQAIPGAKYVELGGADHAPWGDDADAIVGEIEEFLTGERRTPEVDRVLTTVLFVDIVGSTETAVSFGDRKWRDLLSDFHGAVRRELTRFRGREIDTAGDGFLASFDGPARAARCAGEVIQRVAALGLHARAGVHTGECELIGEKLGGVAVHIGARIAALAGSDEVLASATLRDLVAGSGLTFSDRGLHSLKGIPGDWRLYSVVS